MRADRINAKRPAEETKNLLALAKGAQKVSRAADPHQGPERASRVGFGAPLAMTAGVAMISLAARSSRSTTSYDVK